MSQAAVARYQVRGGLILRRELKGSALSSYSATYAQKLIEIVEPQNSRWWPSIASTPVLPISRNWAAKRPARALPNDVDRNFTYERTRDRGRAEGEHCEPKPTDLRCQP